jgi:hypothetical protein
MLFLSHNNNNKTNTYFIKTLNMRAVEIAQQLRALIVFSEVLSSIPSNHMVAYNHL